MRTMPHEWELQPDRYYLCQLPLEGFSRDKQSESHFSWVPATMRDLSYYFELERNFFQPRHDRVAPDGRAFRPAVQPMPYERELQPY
jgi:hypothetical protein